MKKTKPNILLTRRDCLKYIGAAACANLMPSFSQAQFAGPAFWKKRGAPPAPAIWAATNATGAPTRRDDVPSASTGTELILWGGQGSGTAEYRADGFRYNPSTDTWVTLNATGAPTAKKQHSLVWTGTQMIVWGGRTLTGSGPFVSESTTNTGGVYTLSTNSWTATNTTGAPLARRWHEAVWTGSKKVVWGGVDNSGTFLNTGGVYDPTGSGSWTATDTTTAPSARRAFCCVWTGTRMFVWGGWDGTVARSDGALYNPADNSWAPLSASPLSGRAFPRAVWTGTRVLVWGGDFTTDGALYNPSDNTWASISSTGAPSARNFSGFSFNDGKFYVWGGKDSGGVFLNTGAVYDVASNSWTALPTTNAPTARQPGVAEYVNGYFVVWGGKDGAGYPADGGRYG